MDLILLDLMLPDISGYTVLKEIRKISEVPVIILSARSAVADQMSGFEKGADDYITKPFTLALVDVYKRQVQGYVCVSRPRRFGKSMAANMLTAYYSRGCDSREIFSKFEISESPDFEKYRNKYNTIFLNMQEFLSRSDSVEALVDRVKKLVLRDLKREYPDVDYFDDTDLVLSLIHI